MTVETVQGVFENAMDSMSSGIRIGSDPSEEQIREEVGRLSDQGKDGVEIGQQIGPYFTVSEAHGKRELDLLEEVLTEEFDDYNKEPTTHD